MQLPQVMQFTEIDIAKQFVVDEMVQMWRSEGRTLVLTYSSEPYVERVIETLYQKCSSAVVELVQFDDEKVLYSQLERFATRSFRHIVVFNSFHRLTSLEIIELHLARLLDERGILHLSWPAQSLLGYTAEFNEVDIAKMVTERIFQPFDIFRKSDKWYLDAFKSFRCHRLSKFDFNLSFNNVDGIESWHQGGADLLFGTESDRVQEKSMFYTKLFEQYQLGRYEARMTTTVADLSLKIII